MSRQRFIFGKAVPAMGNTSKHEQNIESYLYQISQRDYYKKTAPAELLPKLVAQ
jgi:hypothetical protein